MVDKSKARMLRHYFSVGKYAFSVERNHLYEAFDNSGLTSQEIDLAKLAGKWYNRYEELLRQYEPRLSRWEKIKRLFTS